MMLRANNLHKSFGEFKILKGLSLDIEKGKSIAIVGKSGIGKSTLLHILGTLEDQDSGEIFIDQEKVTASNRDSLRKSKIGFIFQNFNILEDFSVLDNLKIAAMIRNANFNKDLAIEFLNKVELAEKAQVLGKFLSGGEKQRLAIARALIHSPKIVLADEPTGSLDTKQAMMIENLLTSGVKEGHASLIIVTHDLDLANKCDQIYHLKDGILSEKL